MSSLRRTPSDSARPTFDHFHHTTIHSSAKKNENIHSSTVRSVAFLEKLISELSTKAAFSILVSNTEFTHHTLCHTAAADTLNVLHFLQAAVAAVQKTHNPGLQLAVGVFCRRTSSSTYDVAIITQSSSAQFAEVYDLLEMWSSGVGFPLPLRPFGAVPICAEARAHFDLSLNWRPSQDRIFPGIPLPDIHLALTLSKDETQPLDRSFVALLSESDETFEEAFPFDSIHLSLGRPCSGKIKGTTHISFNRKSWQEQTVLSDVTLTTPDETLIIAELIVQPSHKPFIAGIFAHIEPFRCLPFESLNW